VLACLVVICGSGSILARITVPLTPPDFPRPPRRLNPAVVFRPLWSGPREFRVAVLMRFLFLLGLYPVQRFLLFYLEDRFDIADPVAGASLFIMVAVIVAALGGLCAGLLDKRAGAATILRVSIIVGVVGLVGMAAAPVVLVAGISGLVLAVGAGAFQAANWGLTARAVKADEGARYFGLANAATAGASALAGALGPVVDVASSVVPGATYQVLFGLCALVALSSLLTTRRMERHQPGGNETGVERLAPDAAAGR
jgi:MFS family permease